MARRPREEESLGQRFARWFRRNEQIFWILLLIFVCFSFGATYIMARVLADPERKTFMTVDGIKYSVREIRQLNSRLRLISSIPAAPDYVRLASNPSRSQDREESVFRIMARLLAADAEARRLGIVVPPSKVTEVARKCFEEDMAWQKIREQTKYMSSKEYQQYVKDHLEEIRKTITWSPSAYWSWISEKGLSIRNFESALELLLRVQALQELFLRSDPISRKDIYENFVRQRRKLVLAIAEIPFSRFEKEVKADFTDEELQRYYKEHTEKFVLPERISFEYMVFPRSHFEKDITITEADISMRYRQDRESKYLANPAALPPAAVYPLTPEEQKEFEQLKATRYLPLQKVRSRIETDLRRERALAKAASFATNLVNKIKKAKEAAAEGKPAATPEEIAKENDFVKYGKTPPFTADDAEKKLGYLYVKSLIGKWFREISEKKEPTLPPSYLQVKDEKGETHFLIITSVTVHPMESLTWEEDPERCKEIARKELSRDKVRERARQEAEKLIVKVREGRKLTEVAGSFPVTVTEPIGRTDWEKLKLKGDAELPPQIKGEIFRNFFDTLPLNERVVPNPLEDQVGKRFFVCAIEKIAEQPDPSEFTPEVEKQTRRYLAFQLQYRRLAGGWVDYLRTLVAKYVKASPVGEPYLASAR